MARRTLGDIMTSYVDVDHGCLDATSEEDIRRHAREDGHDPDGPIDNYRRVQPPRAIREHLGLTQVAFAAALRVPVGTVRNWEQARTLPDPAARSLLDAVAAEPDAVLGALHDTAPSTRVSEQQFAVASDDGFRSVEEDAFARLAQRRDIAGRPLFDAVSQEAAKRLRSDLIAACLIPSGGTDRDPIEEDESGSHDPMPASDRLIAARQRVRRALDAVGDDMSGFLVDLCGFLKDLRHIEKERRWPSRSAEVVSRIALRRLAAHYGLPREPSEVERPRLQIQRPRDRTSGVRRDA